MRHLKHGRRLGRTSAHRKALFRNLVLSLIRHGRVRTTDAKAKELRSHADRIITLGKRGDLAARRRAYTLIGSHHAVKKLFDEIAPQFKDRAGGYTRVVKIGTRRGDAAMASVIEFTTASEGAQAPKRRRKKPARKEQALPEALAARG